MGENRPTSMRGSGMEDVIFGGAGNRTMRNNAEVTLLVDNADRGLPPPYRDFDIIEVTRRIERDAGSAYRINGREVRQRDVQIFFADGSTGAASPALVRQGQITLLINQKPLARRAILEEAAGISGLHQRRHEAELRLREAEKNLGRLGDIIGEVETQLQALRRQARQATRYRNLSGAIYRTEALLFCCGGTSRNWHVRGPRRRWRPQRNWRPNEAMARNRHRPRRASARRFCPDCGSRSPPAPAPCRS